ncbi:MAG: GTP cyclohydrolase I FolE2 [Schwartzia sp.]|nr:GTP cyclohydrolase I FolE2 [Schwartzia sp. (in: firmicutes)]
MEDIQNSVDSRGIAIQHVGVREIHLPFQIRTKEGDFQQVLARICFTVSLPQEYKGTHMSRFMEILNQWSDHPIAEPEMEQILDEALKRLSAASADIEIRFKYFIQKVAPASGKRSLLDLDCCFFGRKGKDTGFVFEFSVDVPVTSLCPCSKSISRYGAHNQRGIMRARLRFQEGCDCIYIEDLADLMEQQASSPLYPLLKREDEKYVTEHAYENPKFVEDMLRDLVLAFRKLPGLQWFSVSCENYESIHNHNAYADYEEWVK